METWLLPEGNMVAPQESTFRLLFQENCPRENMVTLQEEHSCSLREHIYMLSLDVLPRGATMFPQGAIMFETLCEHNFCM